MVGSDHARAWWPAGRLHARFTGLRAELAAESPRRTSRSVMQIATEVGYDSEAAFNRAFKRRFGNPPALYRRQLRASRN